MNIDPENKLGGNFSNSVERILHFRCEFKGQGSLNFSSISSFYLLHIYP